MAKYCSQCGNELNKGERYCPKCGTDSEAKEPVTEEYISENGEQPKSKIGAGLLAIFLGYLGVHNFYLGYTSKGIAQLLLTLVGWIACGLGPVAASIWGLIEGILILTGSINKDANGIPLQN